MMPALALADRPDSLDLRPDRGRARLHAAIDQACGRIAPLWPLKHFVAVNPFLGFTEQSFESAAAYLDRVVASRILMPRGFYRAALEAGTIDDRDLATAIAASPTLAGRLTVERLRSAAYRAGAGRPRAGAVATVAEILDRLALGDRQLSRTAFMIDEISKWCAAYFDQGQSVWRHPYRDLPLFGAWRAAMRHDRNPEAMGITGFRALIAQLPAEPVAAIAFVLGELAVPHAATADYLYRALFDIRGWAGYVRYLVWQSELRGQSDDRLVQLLALRVVWGYALFRQRNDRAFADAWSAAMAAAAPPPTDGAAGEDLDQAIDFVFQRAYEAAYQRGLFESLSLARPGAPVTPAQKPLQAAFCIDVRSEIFRRALESVCPQAETIGFAGFFGFPIEYVPLGQETGGAQCPVLLKPAYIVRERVRGVSEQQEKAILNLRLARRRAGKAWKAFKLMAISSFGYVETAGLLFGGKMVADSIGLTRTVPDPECDGIDPAILDRVGPAIAPQSVAGRATGFGSQERLDMAEAVLRGMSLTQDFARLVLLAGHGSTTVNNPHASSLDCGACGGHSGKANARVAATILNDPDVRGGLRDRGIDIPAATWFIAALHDTTTDAVTLFDAGLAPAGLEPHLAELRAWLAEAAGLARAERAAPLGLAGARSPDRAIAARSRDWSQVRPEWGLAGNAAFIAAPRSVTARADLAGRTFLHSYDWRADEDFRILELIMTAPMVVATWINLQYYGSAIDNRSYGAGNKVLHNVCGGLGVLEGNAGDLKVGLPLQSVHDGSKLVHAPVRLTACIAAPRNAIAGVIGRHESVRDLVENRWLHLYAMADDGHVSHRYAGNFTWEALK